MSINKKELAKLTSEKVEGLTQKLAGEVIDSVLETIVESLAKGEIISLTGFGKFEPVERAERKGVNPSTMQEITIPPSRGVKFKASKNFKDSVKGE